MEIIEYQSLHLTEHREKGFLEPKNELGVGMRDSLLLGGAESTLMANLGTVTTLKSLDYSYL